MIHIAIVGSGPSGCYLADVLAKKVKDVQVDIYERLPTPFGLVRAGVAPDHQHTKNITKQLERTLSHENVRFIGNVHIGQDIQYSELKQHYHIVAIAIGASVDRSLNLDNAGQGVYGSAAFVGWYNGHPDHSDLNPSFGNDSIAIIGNGNVALDIGRVLAKTREELAQSDISSAAQKHIQQASLRNIYIIGRRGPLDASFTPMELAELGQLEHAVTLTDSNSIPEILPENTDPKLARTLEKNLKCLHQYANNNANSKAVNIHFLFSASPTDIQYQHGNVCALTLHNNLADTPATTLDVGAIITAIGYNTAPFQGLPFDETQGVIKHKDGLVENDVYCAGWCKRGPQGVIPANRADATAVAKQIIQALELQPPTIDKPGFAAFSEQLAALPWVSFSGWQRINEAEISQAQTPKPREKFTHISDMLTLIR